MRLIEIIIPKEDKEKLQGLLNKDKIVEQWTAAAGEEQLVMKILIENEHSQELLDFVEEQDKGYRVIIYPVEGTRPKVEDPQETEQEKIKIGKFTSISKEELFHDIDEPVNLSFNFILMVVLSSFVAGIGILKGNVAIIIGGMVIAPFLGPNISMAFGTTLGDLSTIKKSVITGLAASAIVILISVLWGFMFDQVSQIERDASIEYQDVLLALICGFAGVISVISGQGSSLVGVMVAAALLPPLMRSGLLLGGGYFSDALNSFLIFTTNIVCLNIAGIITFYLAGIRPNRWWEQKQAKEKTRRAIIIWTVALVVLIAVIFALKKLS